MKSDYSKGKISWLAYFKKIHFWLKNEKIQPILDRTKEVLGFKEEVSLLKLNSNT